MTQDDPTPSLALDHFLCFSIYAANHAFNRVYKPLLDAIGLTYPQYLVMAVLWEKDDVTVGAIGERLFLESSTLTPLLKRLEGMGLVTRSRDRQDERQVRIGLTEAGRTLRGKAAGVPACIFEASGLDVETGTRLKQDLDALRQRLAR
ncbi:MarR family transcriptional regulator [Aquibium sp. ELW1220]|uniref:MarR family winged helix-turn-helix transcriptional regulator n=1 Tax=Aquibium sp. ELW1220 TaxID=2976766 RepID=UPI0025B18E2D|nr:MarR family transcriptional regulator [Aquibium sp. ELW1220]MDN2582792.1 MarR family transcriptional regulator [Aquibium sp. ELW1220]